MPAQENTYIDQITVNPDNSVSVRHITYIEQDGVVIATNYIRYTLQKGADLSTEDSRVVTIANAIWNI